MQEIEREIVEIQRVSSLDFARKESIETEMGLLTYIERLSKRLATVRLLMVGPMGSGKSTLLRDLAKEDWNEFKTEDGRNIRTVSKKGISLSVWDLDSKHDSTKHWDACFEECNAIIFVIDSADKYNFRTAAAQLRTLMRNENLSGKALLVFANKSDVEWAIGVDEVAEHLQLEHIRDREWMILATSGETGEGVIEGFEWAAKNAVFE